MSDDLKWRLARRVEAVPTGSRRSAGARRAVGARQAPDGQSALGGRPTGSWHSAADVLFSSKVLHYITNSFENYLPPM